jgi:serine/threonine-protein kinase
MDNSEAFIGLVTMEDNRRTLAFVCDGGSLATWFQGTAGPDEVAISSGGAKLTAQLTRQAAAGTVVLNDGRVLTFTATPSSGEAGLYQAKRTLGALEYLGGWIVLPNGEQRGTVLAGGSTYPPGPLTPSKPTVKVPAGTLEAKRITP